MTARGNTDAYVAKYTPDGSLAWARRMGGDVAVSSGVGDGANAVAVDGSGTVLVVGQGAVRTRPANLSITHTVPSPVGLNSATLWYYGPGTAWE